MEDYKEYVSMIYKNLRKLVRFSSVFFFFLQKPNLLRTRTAEQKKSGSAETRIFPLNSLGKPSCKLGNYTNVRFDLNLSERNGL